MRVAEPDSISEPQASGAPPAQPDAEIERPWRRDPIAWLIGLLGLCVLFYSLWWASRLGDTSVTDRFTGAATVPSGLLLILVVIGMHRSGHVEPRTRRAWSIIALAVAVYGTGALIRFGNPLVPGASLLSPAVSFLEIGAYPLIALALALLPKPPRTRYDIVLFSLDVAIVAWSAAILLWHFLIFPSAREAGADTLTTLGAAAFPVADLALVFAIVAIVIRGLPASSRSAFGVAAVALLVAFAADMISGIDLLDGSYSAGGFAGVLFSLAWLLLAAAAYLQWRIRDGEWPMEGLADFSRSFPWLPYVAVAVAFLAPAIRDWNDPEMLRQHVPATGLLMALVVTRLAVTVRQNAMLAAADRERLATAVEQAAGMMITTDGAGHIAYVNPAFTRIMGYTAAEAIGGSTELMSGGTDSARVGEMRAALRRGKNWEGRLVAHRRDGTEVDLAMSIAPLRDAAGAITGSVAVARDISRERALEAQLTESQRMEAVGRLAGGIAHDFNNILTAISGFGELASTEISADDPVAADIDEILKASDRAAVLTRALLAFGRRQVMQPTRVDLNDVVDGLKPMLGVLLGEDIELVIRPGPELGMVMIDRGQLEQVVMNLATNARYAMPESGKLTISTANASIDAGYARSHVGAVPGPHVKLSVADTGVGMAPEVMEHAFEPFFTTKARGKGTGLGLSTVIGVVQQSGGTVAVSSTPGKGSVFTILLPYIEGGSESTEPTNSENPAHGGTETILVAEDQEAVRQYVKRVLSRAGYRVHAAPNAQEALGIAKKLAHVDLLFTDMVMPGMGGPELARLLTAIHPDVRTLYASGYSEEALAQGF
ncbi:MAG: ATP-binding protein, partial [Candidatus Limnocylindrales bacterium]